MAVTPEKALRLPRCPHCNAADPYLGLKTNFVEHDSQGNEKTWGIYVCGRCAGVVSAHWKAKGSFQSFPKLQQAVASSDIPERPRAFIQEAMGEDKPHSTCLLLASALDAMLKEKGLVTGSLFRRIQQATEGDAPLFTKSMAEWAHDIRLDANDHRHADPNAPLATMADARRLLEFTTMIAELLYVLPARVERGRAAAPVTEHATTLSR
ncbi:MAG: DUF4145 domain-containing protein [Phycisphaerales bacterium]|nr:DUF4145 domain-containing protein [Phycisphaerales bacterium]